MSDIVDNLSDYIRAGFDPHNQLKEARSEIERLRSENARLREALRGIAGARPRCCEISDAMQGIARAALAEKGEK